MNKRFWPLCALLFSTSLWADDEAVFFTLTRRGESGAHLPSNISVITAEDIQRAGAKTLDEVLGQVPSVILNRSGELGSFTSLRMRGAPSSGQTQVVVDEQPLGGVSVQFVDLSQIPVENIERIEVVRGGSSVLYGANTLGGVVHIITKRHTQKESVTTLSVENRSYNTGINRLEFGTSGGGFDGFFTASRYSTNGFQENSDAENVTVTGKGGYNFPNGARVFLDLSRSDHEVGDAQGTSVPLGEWNGRRERAALDPTTRIFNNINTGRLGVDLPLGPVTQIKSSFYGYDQDYITKETFFPTDIDHLIIGNDTRLDLPGHNTLGFSFERDFRKSEGQAAHHVVNWGLYAQSRLTAGPLDVMPGVRFDQHGTFGNVYNPRLTLIYRVAETWKLSANAARSYRAPTMAQLFDFFPGGGFFADFTGNPDLRPETGWTYDAGLEKGTADFNCRLTGFYSRLRDLIQSVSLSPTLSTNENAPRAEIYGAELEATAQTGILRNRLSVTGQRGRRNFNTSSDYVDLALTPIWTGFYEALLSLPGKWELVNQLNYSHRQYTGNDNSGAKIPSHTVWDIRLVKRVLSAEAFFGVQNVTDKHYATTGFGTTLNPQAGRTYSGGVSIRFEN